ncbi:hypothetical protein FNV43_RR22083 [Rhamnella rubrinervis]|uniref:J domain-containing protein n=1 Tax=Rhamnella rubrinervis TaxID=2594499 RepID=A0A8K0GRR2_9ROSA|nr:hypothetical protein FNV43_RR22083 [Rhamnella rubrinervis]
MAFSLTSSIEAAKPLLPYPNNIKNQRRRPHKVFISFTCRSSSSATTQPESNTNFYKMLCLSPERASMDEIKKAYRSMARRHHPDVCHDPSMKEESTKMFAQLNEAYQTLSDPVLRQEYDYEMGFRSSFGRTFKADLNDRVGRQRWQEQIVELKRRSNRRMAQKEGYSWGSRMRAQQ